MPAVNSHSSWGDRKQANAHITKLQVVPVPGEGSAEQKASSAQWQLAHSTSVPDLQP